MHRVFFPATAVFILSFWMVRNCFYTIYKSAICLSSSQGGMTLSNVKRHPHEMRRRGSSAQVYFSFLKQSYTHVIARRCQSGQYCYDWNYLGNINTCHNIVLPKRIDLEIEAVAFSPGSCDVTSCEVLHPSAVLALVLVAQK